MPEPEGRPAFPPNKLIEMPPELRLTDGLTPYELLGIYPDADLLALDGDFTPETTVDQARAMAADCGDPQFHFLLLELCTNPEGNNEIDLEEAERRCRGVIEDMETILAYLVDKQLTR